jgi:hypothetical protein
MKLGGKYLKATKTLKCPVCYGRTGGSAFRLLYSPDPGVEEEFFLECIDCGEEYSVDLMKEVLVNLQYNESDDKPETFYNVEMCRIGYGSRVIAVKAQSEKEASEKALDEAGDHEYSEKSSEYEVQGVWKADSLGA